MPMQPSSFALDLSKVALDVAAAAEAAGCSQNIIRSRITSGVLTLMDGFATKHVLASQVAKAKADGYLDSRRRSGPSRFDLFDERLIRIERYLRFNNGGEASYAGK